MSVSVERDMRRRGGTREEKWTDGMVRRVATRVDRRRWHHSGRRDSARV